MALTEESKKQLQALGTSLAEDIGVGVAMIIAEEALESLAASNIKESDPSGDRESKPTDDQAVLDEKKAEGNSNEGSLAKDDVKAQGGEVAATQTNAEANQNQAKALDTGAKALQTSAGATEIATKALKMN
ncbi:hypothetical protein SAMN02910357_01548 [Succinivibrio dextrinosolvens]|uniref:hypothetical protein n=1 Tax=Succinivibrio dextrinosolvens TaxID=83771 RepID=UPI0008F4483D|nr:hypothetical protein [Succinivibrio dextrinosolvens]SFS73321.1 hypothetical protein SAMN02910357_01548 [Succinivibrio dextrinosolvens]